MNGAMTSGHNSITFVKEEEPMLEDGMMADFKKSTDVERLTKQQATQNDIDHTTRSK